MSTKINHRVGPAKHKFVVLNVGRSQREKDGTLTSF